MELHQQIVRTGAAVHAQFLQPQSGISLHGGEHIVHLIGDALQCGPGDVCLGGATREAAQNAACVLIPMRCAEPGKGGHEVHTAIVRYVGRKLFDFGGTFEKLQTIAQPLGDCAGNEDAAFQRKLRAIAHAPRNGGK